MSDSSCQDPPVVRYPDDLELAEAALSGDEKAITGVKDLVEDPQLRYWLVRRGASAAEADDLLGDLLGDCFGGQKKSGGLIRLLGKFNGGCKLQNFFRRVVLHRFIDKKRRETSGKTIHSLDDDEEGNETSSGLVAPDPVESEDVIVQILTDAIRRAFAAADQEKLILFRLHHSYRLPQTQIGEMWHWHHSKVSRAISSLRDELQAGILAAVRQADPWLELEWEDFIELCGDSVDLFAY